MAKIFSTKTFNSGLVVDRLISAISADLAPLTVVIDNPEGMGGSVMQDLIDEHTNWHHAKATDMRLEVFGAERLDLDAIIRSARSKNTAVAVFVTGEQLAKVDTFLDRWGKFAVAITDTRIPSWMPEIEL